VEVAQIGHHDGLAPPRIAAARHTDRLDQQGELTDQMLISADQSVTTMATAPLACSREDGECK